MGTGDDLTNNVILHIQQGPKPHLRKYTHAHVRVLRCNTEFITTAVRNDRDSKQATLIQRYTEYVDEIQYEKGKAVPFQA